MGGEVVWRREGCREATEIASKQPNARTHAGARRISPRQARPSALVLSGARYPWFACCENSGSGALRVPLAFLLRCTNRGRRCAVAVAAALLLMVVVVVVRVVSCASRGLPPPPPLPHTTPQRSTRPPAAPIPALTLHLVRAASCRLGSPTAHHTIVHRTCTVDHSAEIGPGSGISVPAPAWGLSSHRPKPLRCLRLRRCSHALSLSPICSRRLCSSVRGHLSLLRALAAPCRSKPPRRHPTPVTVQRVTLLVHVIHLRRPGTPGGLPRSACTARFGSKTDSCPRRVLSTL